MTRSFDPAPTLGGRCFSAVLFAFVSLLIFGQIMVAQPVRPSLVVVLAPQVACNDNWDDRFGVNAPNDVVRDVVTDGAGNIYIGGEFTMVGNVPANHVAKWNGSSWSALGSGLNNDVVDLEWSGSDLYALGPFSQAGGNTANRVAKWNGSSWSPVGAGFLGNVVNAIAVSGSTVYVAGYSLVTINTFEVVRFNGTSWARIGQPFGNGTGPRALAIIGTTVFAGGGFTLSGGGPAEYIAQYNGATWQAVGTGMNGQVLGLAVAGSDLYAGGQFTVAGGNSANRIAKWNGSSWSALGAGIDGNVKSIAVSGNDLYAGGTFTTAGVVSASNVAKWSSSTWSPLGAGMNNGTPAAGVNSLAISGSDLYAGGSFSTAGCRDSLRFAHYFNQAFVGGTDNDWYNAANWSGGAVPSANSDATVSGADISITSNDVTIRDLRIDAGRTVSVGPGRTLTITRNLNLLGSITGPGNVVVTACDPNAVARDASAGGYVASTLTRCVNNQGTYEFPVGVSGYSPVRLANVVGTGNVSITPNNGAYSSPATGLPANRLARWWQIENSGGGITQTDLVFNYLDPEIAGTEANYRAFRISGGSASQIPSSVDTTANTVTAVGVTQFSDWTLAQAAAPTAANVSITGRVLTRDLRGVSNAIVRMTTQDGVVRQTRSGAFGYYRFDGVTAGQTVVLELVSKRRSAASRVVWSSDSMTGIDLMSY